MYIRALSEWIIPFPLWVIRYLCLQNTRCKTKNGREAINSDPLSYCFQGGCQFYKAEFERSYGEKKCSRYWRDINRHRYFCWKEYAWWLVSFLMYFSFTLNGIFAIFLFLHNEVFFCDVPTPKARIAKCTNYQIVKILHAL